VPADIDVSIPDNNPIPQPSELDPLLDELDIPSAIAGQVPLRTSPAGLGDEAGVFQIPEPSTLALLAIGAAGVARRRVRRRDR
jgi:hypothetical protein